MSDVAHCSKCGKVLTDPFSIAVGMGPECRGSLSKKGWKFPKPKYQIRHGRVELVKMVGKIVEPAPVDVTEIKKRKATVQKAKGRNEN